MDLINSLFFAVGFGAGFISAIIIILILLYMFVRILTKQQTKAAKDMANALNKAKTTLSNLPKVPGVQ